MASDVAAAAVRTLLDGAEDMKAGNRQQELVTQARAIAGELDERPLEKARLAEIDGDNAVAAELYRKAGAQADLHRALRKNADWTAARAGAEGDEAEDIDWLTSIEKAALSRPQGIDGRLYAEEARRLEELVNRIAPMRRHRGKH